MEITAMANSFFKFKQFTIHQQRAAMKVTTDGCLFGAWCAHEINNEHLKINNCLDVGTGTGLLALMIAQKNNCKIDAVEIDEAAYEEAKENIEATQWKNNINIFYSDINEFKGSHYDCIFSNPPFYENELASGNLTKNIAHHSHSLQLQQLFTIINLKLNSEGSFYLLLPYKRKDEIIRLLQEHGLHPSQILSVKQTPKHAPFRLMIKGKKIASALVEDEIIITDESRNYTPAFTALLKDYYLYL